MEIYIRLKIFRGEKAVSDMSFFFLSKYKKQWQLKDYEYIGKRNSLLK